KNHGEAAGASLEHPHSQIIALPILPKQVVEELEGAKRYFANKERCIFCDIIRQETEAQVRVAAENQDFVTLCPYAPRFPFETWILPKRHESAFENSPSTLYENLARMLRTILNKAVQVLDNPAYNLIVHSSPVQENTNDFYHWHLEIIPKLAKTAGFEWGTGFYINPTPPEEAAKFLREAEEMKILFGVSECVPFCKTGGLADVVGALPKELRHKRPDVRIILPKYKSIR